MGHLYDVRAIPLEFGQVILYNIKITDDNVVKEYRQ
jgi:hypothetical protein